MIYTDIKIGDVYYAIERREFIFRISSDMYYTYEDDLFDRTVSVFFKYKPNLVISRVFEL